jgi:hypothetical protein
LSRFWSFKHDVLTALCSNQNAIGGPVPRDTFHDAAALEELFRQDDSWRDWPLLATDGDAAALIEAVSNNQVNLAITCLP